MKPKKINILIFLCALFMCLSACGTEPARVTDTQPTIATEYTATPEPTITPTPVVLSIDEAGLTDWAKSLVPQDMTGLALETEVAQALEKYFSDNTDLINSGELTEELIKSDLEQLINSLLPEPTSTPTRSSTFSVTYLDVGQGDAAIISCDGHYMMIDGGEASCSNQIYSYLKRNGIATLDIVVASHAHADHVGGLSGALNYATAGLVLCPVTEYNTDSFRDFAKFAKTKGPGITVPKAGDTYTLGSAKVTILGLNATGEGNDTSIILTVEYRDTVFLFTGDAERVAEQAVLEDCPEKLEATFLKVGHHGSADATTYPFLREILPEYAIISCGAGNPYGHPTDNTLSRLRDAEAVVLRTDLHGDITVTYNDGQWLVTTAKDASYEDVMTPGDEFDFTADSGGDDEVTRGDGGTTTDGMDYVANKNTKKFHYPGCNSVKQMKESNKVYFNGVTREYMIENGYDPCGNSKP